MRLAGHLRERTSALLALIALDPAKKTQAAAFGNHPGGLWPSL
jgi:hypothetical protein